MCALGAFVFKVGGITYVVRVSSEPLYLHGDVCDGLCLENEREILIAPDIAEDDRLRVLFHELLHAWTYVTGAPGDAEGWADLFAATATAAHQDLTRCGGEEALRRLRAGEVLGVMTGRIMLTRSRYCRCGGTVAAASVDCRVDPRNPGQVTLKMGCDFCGHTMTWNELATQRGLPSGVVVGEVKVEAGAFIPAGVGDDAF